MEEDIIKKRLWFVAAIIIAGIIISLPAPEGLTPEGQKTIALLIMVIILFVAEAIPMAATALLIGVFEVVVIGFESNDVASSYMNDSVFFIMGSLMIAVALVKQGIAQKITLLILSHIGTSVNRIVFGIVASCALVAAFMSDHTVAALMLPVALSISKMSGGFKKNPNLTKLLLFAIAFGCAIGGLATPSGGARNIIAIEYLNSMFNQNITYLDWMIYAFPVTLIMIPITALILIKIFKPEISNLRDATHTLEEEDEEMIMTPKMWISIGIFLFTLFLWIFSGTLNLGLGIAAIIGAVLYLIFGLVKWRDYNSGVAWGVVFLYGGAISLGFMMLDTGAGAWIANNFLNFMSMFVDINGVPVLASAVSILSIATTNTMSGGATVSVIGPITLKMAEGAGISVIVVGMVTAISSAFAYLLVIGSPANAIIYSSGFVKSKDFLLAGAAMTVISFIVLLLVVNFYWIGIIGL
jgi:sodium-dependent dicarboxylate transporter 2/3/5